MFWDVSFLCVCHFVADLVGRKKGQFDPFADIKAFNMATNHVAVELKFVVCLIKYTSKNFRRPEVNVS